MAAFLEATLEAMLKPPFIGRSGWRPQNGAMKVTCALRHSALALTAALLLGPAQADGRADHERARAALQAGQILPLRSVLERLERSHPGQVLEVELEKEDGLWIYEIKLLQADGQLLKLKLDARNAALLGNARKERP